MRKLALALVVAFFLPLVAGPGFATAQDVEGGAVQEDVDGEDDSGMLGLVGLLGLAGLAGLKRRDYDRDHRAGRPTDQPR
ncbi:MAG: WGxxGxxG family protein [Gemmatimonadota bacterium]